MSKQCLDVQEMKHLQELGLDTSNVSAFWCSPDRNGDWSLELTDSWGGKIPQADEYDEFHPAYTLQDVLDALPKEIKYAGERCWLCFEAADERIGYYNEDCNFNREYVYYDVKETSESNIIDSAYRLLCWCIENKFVETNKNE